VAAQGYEGWRYPHVLGVDVAGVIETIGDGVVSWSLGDQVFYHTTWRKDGSHAEFNVAPAHTFARIPEGISFVDAATLPCAALTAYSALYRRLHIREGDIVLVHAAAGGVGGFAIQLAKAAKAFVIGTCSAPKAPGNISARCSWASTKAGGSNLQAGPAPVSVTSFYVLTLPI
jgi:NADPH:quinone reductase